MNIMYPNININLNKLKDNIDKVFDMCSENGIHSVTVVVKAFAGDVNSVKALENTKITDIGDSRIQNLKKFKDLNFEDFTLLRIPAISEIKDVISYTTTSLNSELDVIKKLNIEAKLQNKIHHIILMFDLGDLREGMYYTESYLEEIKEIFDLENIHLKGIGTNLTCYGGVVPNKDILNRLIKIKNTIEGAFDITIPIISGGNSSSVTLFGKDEIPQDVNHLRLGESILFGKETSYSTNIPNLNYDVFEFEAEIIELKEKPSYPDGEISINSFGEVPNIDDLGIMKRAILAIGKQDVILENLSPKDQNITIIGGSSDHLIVDVTKGNYKLGDIIKFNINYPGLVHLMNSNYVNKTHK